MRDFFHRRVVVEGGDGTGKTTLVTFLRRWGFTNVHDRGELTLATDDPTVQPVGGTLYIYLNCPVEVAHARLVNRGADMSDPYHQMGSLIHYEARFCELVRSSPFSSQTVWINTEYIPGIELALPALVPLGESIRVGLPEGRLQKHMPERYLGVQTPEGSGVLVQRDPTHPVVWVRARTKAYPSMLCCGSLDLAFMGSDVVKSTPYPLEVLSEIPQEGVDVVFASLTGEFPTTFPLRVGTPFPSWASQILGQRGIPHVIYDVAGCSEGLVANGLADVVFDVRETGSALRSNGLKVIESQGPLNLCLVRAKS